MNFQSEDFNAQFATRRSRSKTIKVLLVDDSPLALTILKRMLSSSPDIEIAGTAGNGKKALELLPGLHPTVICTDFHMPVMDGLEFTREVMAQHPTPILVVSVSVQDGSANVFELLEAGALDVFPKPRGGLASEFSRAAPELIQKIRILAGVRVFRKARRETVGIAAPNPEPEPEAAVRMYPPPRIVVIGASTGGPNALHTIVSGLPADFPVPVVCVQHISDGFMAGLVEWLASQSKLRVELARSGESPLPGRVYFPAEGAHLTFDDEGKFLTTMEPPFEGHRPSITLTMRSVVHHYGNAVVGVLLTGMGKDGAEGLLSIQKAGGLTVAQDEESSIVFGMPRQAIELGAARHVIPLDKVAGLLIQACGR